MKVFNGFLMFSFHSAIYYHLSLLVDDYKNLIMELSLSDGFKRIESSMFSSEYRIFWVFGKEIYDWIDSLAQLRCYTNIDVILTQVLDIKMNWMIHYKIHMLSANNWVFISGFLDFERKIWLWNYGFVLKDANWTQYSVCKMKKNRKFAPILPGDI